MIGALRRIVQLFSRKRKKMDDDFNLLEALVDPVSYTHLTLPTIYSV